MSRRSHQLTQRLQTVLFVTALAVAQAGVVWAQEAPPARAFDATSAEQGFAEPSRHPSRHPSLIATMPSAAALSSTTTGAAAPHAAGSAYILGPDDEITVKALESDEISGDALRVDLTGYISLPLIGRVPAAGLTTEELEAELSRRLSKYVRDPQVTVGISGLRSQPVSVIGAVNRPGVHQLEGHKTLIEILSLLSG